MADQINFDDLTPHSRWLGNSSLDGVLNVGWINVKSNFPTGSTPIAVAERLKLIATETTRIQSQVEPTRSLPHGEICGAPNLRYCGVSMVESELWIPGGDVVFASPITIIHFIELHQYLPPKPIS